MKRNLVRLVLAVLFVLAIGAVPTMAQVAFTASSTLLPVRGEGTKEAVGQVVLGATTNGTIKGGTLTPPGSAIVVTFSAPIGNIDPTTGTAGVLTCLPTTICGGTETTLSASGSTLTIKFLHGDAVIMTGNSYTISGLRINASALSTGSLTANITAVVPPAVSSTNPITITNPTVTVANVIKPSFALTTGTPGSILTCNPAEGTSFSVTLTENYPSAFTSESDEIGLAAGSAGEPITNGSQISVTVTNVPSGVTINAETPSYPTTPIPQTSLTIALDSTTPGSVMSTGAPITFLYDVQADNPTAVESVILGFELSFNGTLPSSPPPPSVTVAVSLAPIDQSKTPAFVAGNSIGGGTGVTVSACVTYILLPWVTNYQVASSTDPRSHYDTGIVIGNTTTDPFGAPGSALPQNGNCVLTMYPWDGSASTTYTTATANSGTSLLFTASTAFPGKSGYVAGLCNFQNAHSYVYIVDNSGLGPAHTAADYLGLIVPNPALIHRNPAGGGEGESLAH